MSDDIVAARGVIWEDSGVTLLMRFENFSGQAAVQADITSIAYAAFNEDSATPDTALVSTTVATTDVVFNTLQNDNRWKDRSGIPIDSVGYNFRHTLSSTIFATPSKLTAVEYLFTPTTGQPWYDRFEIEVKPIRRS